MKQTTVPTHNVDIFIAGSLEKIEQVCREYCMVGLCVTVSPVSFVFTYGKETGAKIGLINYARFPMTPEQINDHARSLAELLAERCCQRSCSIVTPTETTWLTNT